MMAGSRGSALLLILSASMTFASACRASEPSAANAVGDPGEAAAAAADSAAGERAVAVFSAAAAETADFVERVERAAAAAALPAELGDALAAAARDDRASFEAELAAAAGGDAYLVALVDKEYALSETYAPADLVELSGGSYSLNRAGLTLRAPAAASLEKMAASARGDGITLLVSSAYRSYDYQKAVYQRIVAELGQEGADRESARPGHSQHQTGLAVDFGSIDDSFAGTAASRWLEANAGRFGWSLSYPKGYEALTGYRWESWHYRFVGEEAAAFIDRRFSGIQQYALGFLRAWQDGKRP